MYFWLTEMRLLHCSSSIYQRVVARVPDGVSVFILPHKAVPQNEADNAMFSTPTTDRRPFEGSEPDGMTQSIVSNSCPKGHPHQRRTSDSPHQA